MSRNSLLILLFLECWGVFFLNWGSSNGLHCSCLQPLDVIIKFQKLTSASLPPRKVRILTGPGGGSPVTPSPLVGGLCERMGGVARLGGPPHLVSVFFIIGNWCFYRVHTLPGKSGKVVEFGTSFWNFSKMYYSWKSRGIWSTLAWKVMEISNTSYNFYILLNRFSVF